MVVEGLAFFMGSAFLDRRKVVRMPGDILPAIAGVLSIVVIDLVLSGDNAVVIGLAVRRLPTAQRRRGIVLGGAGAIGLRVLFAALAAYLLTIPFLHAAGGLLLLWIAWKLLRDEATSHGVSERESLFGALRTIILADVVMSLDNVLAIAGVSHGNVGQLLLGLLLSMPIILFSSGVVAAVMNRLPWLSMVGAGILAWTAGGMIQEDDLVSNVVAMGTLADPLIPLALTVAIVAPSVRRLWNKHASSGRLSLRQRIDGG